MSDWWTRKLSGDTRPAPVVPQNYPMHTQPPAQPVPPQASHQRSQAGSCPGCGGDNYFSMGQGKPRCYDCGYPIEQQSTGMTASGPSKPARQVQSSGYQPTNIQGRIS